MTYSDTLQNAFNVSFSGTFAVQFDSAASTLLGNMLNQWANLDTVISIIRLDVEAEQMLTGHDLDECVFDVVTRLSMY